MSAPVAWRHFLLVATLAVVIPNTAAVQAARDEMLDAPDVFDPQAAIAYSQSAIGNRLGNHRFVAADGVEIRLSEYRGRPLVISLVFTACVQSCPVVTEHLRAAVEEAQSVLGTNSFSVVTVGFDTQADRPERLSAYAKTHGADLPNWRFLSGDEKSVSSLIRELGFIRMSSPRGFDHIAQTSIIDSEGKVFQQVYGDSFEAPALVDPLKTLMFKNGSLLSSVSGAIERVRLFCTFYDPRSGRYAFDFSFFISLAIGGLSLLGVGAIVIRMWIQSRKPPESPA